MNGRIKDRKKGWAFLFILANVVLFLLFFAWPGVLGIYYSFTDYTGVEANFIGFQNYIELFQDSSFYKAMSRTFLYTALGVPMIYIASLGISVLLVSNYTKGKAVTKTIFFLPWLISPIVTGVIWRWMFGESFGFINYLISIIGGDPIPWSSNGDLAFMVVLFATTWANTAFNMLIFIAALINIPKSYYEAAELDGANGWHKFWYITLPSIRGTSFMVILLAVFHLMKEFPLVQALTNGGPGTDNTFIVQYIYQTGFDQMRVGYASAVSMILFIILLIFALIQLRFEKRGRI
ncbi:carbohydrate ABC transporter permease [Pseudalkalibacillus hwajinpoensis]|uniref:carbohydrate ABC transporter permease n=1 Tax=Guptibacillus hwajinpoensis TaxID=208199 RepID=UPI001CD7D205|nr:sugar ABC transporter permease [Pseudalkalibacillus hwajinpoensis]MCA0991349.1 sugar ABC transporter permease [Pseudalkalibacillus hwajinpoensis]